MTKPSITNTKHGSTAPAVADWSVWMEDDFLETPELTPDRARIARMVALSGMTIPQIAEEIGITRQTARVWSLEPAVKQRIKEINSEFDKQTLRTGFAVKRNRIEALCRVAERLERKILSAARPSIGLIKEFRATLEQIAKETGTWTERFEFTAEFTGPPQVREMRIYLTERENTGEVIDVEHTALDEGE